MKLLTASMKLLTVPMQSLTAPMKLLTAPIERVKGVWLLPPRPSGTPPK